MPDYQDIYNSIMQFHMMKYCGVSVEKWAHDFMIDQINAGIDLVYCLKYFEEWCNA